MEFIEKHIYRGTDTEDIAGITWWSTEYEVAVDYAEKYGTEGIILHRTIRLPVDNGCICNPDPYLIGGKGRTIRAYRDDSKVNLDTYYYGIIVDLMHVDSGYEFELSINSDILEGLSTEIEVIRTEAVV